MILRHLPLFVAVLLLGSAVTTHALDRSGESISLQNTAYEKDGRWHCPLCHEEVGKSDRSTLDLRLQLSEWHDVTIDPEYFEHRIRHISDAELVASLRIPEIQAALDGAVAAGDEGKVARLLHDYFVRRPDNGRLSLYDAATKQPFITRDQFRREVQADPARAAAIAAASDEVYTPERGFRLFGHTWGERIDFTHTYPTMSKWGVHYLGVLDALTQAQVVQPTPVRSKAFESLFNQWYEQIDDVKPEKVIHVTVSYDFIWYELGLSNRTERLINAQRVFGPDLSPETTKRFLKNLLGSARWMDQCLMRTPFHPYNWQTHTAHTLSYVALAYPEFAESGTWLEHGRGRMVEHIRKDILDDGGYVERTTSYAAYMFGVFHRYMVMFEHFRGDRSLLDEYLPRLEKFIEFFVLTTTPIGTNAPFNDAGRGRDLLPLFAEMAGFFQRGDFIGGFASAYSAAELGKLPVKPVTPSTLSADFPHSRFAVMRESWNPQAGWMMINYGDHQNHSHFDQLSFELYANGQALAVDAGLGALGYLEPAQLTWYKHPTAHNMMTINGAVPVKRNLPGYEKVWALLPSLEVFAATHDGYVRHQGTRLRRHVLWAKGRYWLVVDAAETSAADREMEFNLHTPLAMRPTQDGFISNGNTGFVIRQNEEDRPWTRRERQRGLAQLSGLPGEPNHREIDWLVFRRPLTGKPASDRMATLIAPYRPETEPAAMSCFVERVELPDPAAVGYRVRLGEREDLILVSDGKPRDFVKGIAGDFRYALLSFRSGHLISASFVETTTFRLQDGTTQTFPERRNHEISR